jgi:hypothetical protein
MPWSQTTPMDQKTQFIADYLREIFSFTELCARYGVSRDTGYRLVERYLETRPADSRRSDDRTRVRTDRAASSKRCSSFVVVTRAGARRSCSRCWASAIRAGTCRRARRCSRS